MNASTSLTAAYRTSDKIVARAAALGITKNGTAIVRDQGLELLASAHNFRNRHAFIASLKNKDEQISTAENNGRAYWNSISDAQSWNDISKIIHLEGFLASASLFSKFAAYIKEVADEENSSEAILLDIDVDQDNKVVNNHLHNLPMQIATESLQRNFGYEHSSYPREDWQYDVANGDTKLGYWEWVQHNIESNVDVTVNLKNYTVYSFSIGALSQGDLYDHAADELGDTFDESLCDADIRSLLLDNYDSKVRALADAAYESLNIDGMQIVDCSGWTADTYHHFSRSVFAVPVGSENMDSKMFTFSLDIEYLQVKSSSIA